MLESLGPLKSVSLKDVFIERFEELIFSGALSIGAKLPPERALATRLGVSRPVVHEGLVELGARGLVTIIPRVGTFVNDFRKEGSLGALNSLINYRKDNLDPGLLHDLLDLRELMECETARLAACHRADSDLAAMRELLEQEREADPKAVEGAVDLDFDLHHRIALASGNAIYPMFIKSCEPTYKHLSGLFFTVTEVRPQVLAMHDELIDAIDRRDVDRAGEVMGRLLTHGRNVLCQLLDQTRAEVANG